MAVNRRQSELKLMGRTARRRKRKAISPPASLDNDFSIISLKKWMKSKNWYNLTSLRLRTFAQTGRGLSASKTIFPNDTLIEIPYELMITLTTLDSSTLDNVILPFKRKNLLIHDALSVFLVFELHEGSRSPWFDYINSLPAASPALPWLCTSEELKCLPQKILAAAVAKLKAFEESWLRVKDSIDPTWICSCCRTSGVDLFEEKVFTWAYVMVNTRSVYLDPVIVRQLSGHSPNSFTCSLADEPSMALCPFLDMFNHSNAAETETNLKQVNQKWAFSLISLTKFEKGMEISISYGKHSNLKLLLEYGFFIPDDDLMEVAITLEEILDVAKISLNERQYKFVKQKGFDRKLSVGTNGLSFNLKAVLFVLLNPAMADWCSYIFSDSYSEHMLEMSCIVRAVVSAQARKLSMNLSSLKSNVTECCSESYLNVVNYLDFELSFMLRLIATFADNTECEK